MAIAKMMEFLKNDFIFTCGWNKLQEHRVLFRLIASSIMERFREDLHIVNAFVKDNIDKIFEEDG